MKPTVYIETSFVSYLTARQSRDLVVAGRQQVSRDWWDLDRSRFALFTSELSILEASAGNPEASAERIAILSSLPLLDVNASATDLADELVAAGAVPAVADRDALHIAICAVHATTYLLTWNFTHLANAKLRSKIGEVCKAAGFAPPVICTPDELMGDSP